MTEERLQELEMIAREATAGPWELAASSLDPSEVLGIYYPTGPRTNFALLSGDGWGGFPLTLPDARHVAAFDPPTALALIAEVQRLRERDRRGRELVQDLCSNDLRRRTLDASIRALAAWEQEP